MARIVTEASSFTNNNPGPGWCGSFSRSELDDLRWRAGMYDESGR